MEDELDPHPFSVRLHSAEYWILEQPGRSAVELEEFDIPLKEWLKVDADYMKRLFTYRISTAEETWLLQLK